MAQDLGGKLVVLVGGTGFLGRHVAQELLNRGARLRVASRHVERAFAIKPLGNLGQVQFARADLTRPESLARAVAGADAVVNLAGTFGSDADAVMGRGAGALAAAAKAAGAAAFVHVSAIGADAEGETGYARAKAAGEASVLAAFPTATVLRPSILFGPDDSFINRFAGLVSLLPVLPVFAPEAKLQPLFVDDCALAIAAALTHPMAHGGKTFELAGPEIVTMLALNQRIARAAGRSPQLVALPDALSGLIAAATGWLPGAPITGEQWKLLKAGNVASGALPGIAALGIAPRPLELFLDRWLVRFRKHGRFADRLTA
ncbi:NADH dehydrogenase [Novosphingobium kunmingense]|uniref:NADH dehydrogenase n=1 Tax=Novosphingobium kunmingense TaxID=1211806 RepID=A0A2N0H6C2_9SPHN|nr:complex I NDUFA9 subunit family protein [Novosphingobium kunmingense]PKB14462.1 NADH dehydrogenase [Novosphingobium kunmingense]